MLIRFFLLNNVCTNIIGEIGKIIFFTVISNIFYFINKTRYIKISKFFQLSGQGKNLKGIIRNKGKALPFHEKFLPVIRVEVEGIPCRRGTRTK